jgi:hypothetical protein
MKSFLIRGASLTILIVALLIILPNYVQAATIRVEAFIDGRSQLIIRGNTAQWRHFEANGPGYDDDYPTIINGADWYPTWLGGDPSDCQGCLSSVFSGVCPGISAVEQNVTLSVIQARESATIIQQPSVDNSYTLIVEFNDNEPGGAAWYIIKLDFPYATPCVSSVPTIVPTMTEWGMIVFVVLAGLGSVYYLRRQKRVNS